MWPFNRKGHSGFSSSATAEEVTAGINGTGLAAIVTGASSGIGRETARVLAMRGVHIIMGVRNLSAGLDVKEAIIKEIPAAKVDMLELDLSSMASVRKFASEFACLNLPLNILINNAGVLAGSFSLSSDGLELHFATNHIGHFLLTNLLVEKMKNTARDSTFEGRIVNVSSEYHMLTYPEGIHFDKINDPSVYKSYLAYGQSKIANILHCNELSRRFEQEGVNITANAIHPGFVATSLFRSTTIVNVLVNTFGKLISKNIEQGAATTCYVALHPQVKGVTGKYFSNCNLATPSSKALDAELAKKLWDFSMKIVEA